MFCQRYHKVGHSCRDKKQAAPVQPQKMKQWQPKGKGKDIIVEPEEEQEAWHKPKKTTASSIQIGNIQVPTDNSFKELSLTAGREGGDLFPSNIT